VPEYIRKKIKNGKRKKTEFNIDLKKLCKLIGYYAAEGHYQNGLYFSFHKNEIEYHNDVKNLIKDIYNLDAYFIDHHQSVRQVAVLSRDIEDNFKNYVTGTDINKKLAN
jgi:hypothetical protein